MAAVPPLARVLRYGDVAAPTEASPACSAAWCCAARSGCRAPPGRRRRHRGEAGGARRRRQQRGRAARGRRRCYAGLARRAAPGPDGDRLPGALAGRATRLLLDAGELDTRDVAATMSRALSDGEAPEAAPPGSRGSSAGPASCWSTTRTCSSCSTTGSRGARGRVQNVLPLLRRAFAVLPRASASRLGERRAKNGARHLDVVELDLERARPALATLARLLA